MSRGFSKQSLMAGVFTLAFSLPLAAQTTEEVKSDVLSALATPLPITIIGPLMSSDVDVSQSGKSFTANLKGTSLMGLFPLGDLSMTLTPEGEDSYKVSGFTLPKTIDFPGMAKFTYATLELTGTWNSKTRSYTELDWTITDLKFAPEGAHGFVTMGALSFDVAKDGSWREKGSHFNISAKDIAVSGLAPQTIKLGALQAQLLAKGDQPVDIYSVIRETIMRSTMNDGGQGLQSLAASLLGNTYEAVTLDLTAQNLDVSETDGDDYLRAETAGLKANLTNVAPRDWGGGNITLTLKEIDQNDILGDGTYALDNATLAIDAASLPVADMLATYKAFITPRNAGSVPVSTLLNGLIGFGKLEVATHGEGLTIKALDYVNPSDPGKAPELRPYFDLGYDSWNIAFGLSDFDKDQGKLTSAISVSGGSFTPHEDFDKSILTDVEAWLPISVSANGAITDLNEGFLKRLFTDISIADIRKPTEIILPLALYFSATVPSIKNEEGHYTTKLFDLTASSEYKLYPTEVLNMVPYEGKSTVKLSGFDNLVKYVTDLPARHSGFDGSASYLSTILSVLTTLRNLAVKDGDALTWELAHPDISRSEVQVNGTTFRYPDLTHFLPLAIMGVGLGRY